MKNTLSIIYNLVAFYLLKKKEKFITEIEDQIVNEDEPAEFTCLLNASTANISWSLNEKTLHNSDNIKITNNEDISILRIENCQLTDSGEIACQIGDKKKTKAKLIVKG